MSRQSNGIDFNGEILEIIPPSPTEEIRGGIKAELKDSNYTVELKLGEDGKLYAPSYPTVTGDGEIDIPVWAQQPNKPTYTASEVGADAKGTASSAISVHNTASDSHSDIRLLITELTTRINTVLNSEDVDLDQLAELVAYIKANRSLIEQVTTNKINVSDIIDNLTTNVANKPLSAKQGVVLKTLIDAIKVPTALSELSADATHRLVTDTEKAIWNAKSNFSGSYNDLSNKPTIPSKTSQLTNDSGYITKVPVEVVVQNGMPNEGNIWIDTDASEEMLIAEIDDDTIDPEKTWSSSKINEKMVQVDQNKTDISKLGGTVEITSDNPSKANTVMTIDPSAEEVNVYSAEEVDAITDELNEKLVQLDEQVDISTLEKGFVHENLPTTTKTITLYKNPILDNVIVFDKKCYRLQGYELTKNGVTHTSNGNVAYLNGTTTAQFTFWISPTIAIDDELKGRTFDLYLFSDSVIDYESSQYGNVLVDGSSVRTITRNKNVFNTTVTSITIPQDSTNMAIKFPIPSGIALDNVIVYSLLVPSDANKIINTTITDDISIIEITDSCTVIDTTIHESEYARNTKVKEYVDKKFDEFEPDNPSVYTQPENFGAIGDGKADDADALQLCVNYAIEKSIPIRAYGTYKISKTINIQGRNLDIFINRLVYSGEEHAVKVIGCFNKIRINKIEASSGSGFYSGSVEGASGYTNVFCYNLVEFTQVLTKYNCLFLDGNGENIYNEYHFNILNSTDGNAIYIKKHPETVIKGSKISASEYGIYSEVPAECKVYDVGFESSCKNAVYGYVSLINCRTRECVDLYGKNGDLNQGILYKLNNYIEAKYEANPVDCDYVSVSVEDLIPFENLHNDLKAIVDTYPVLTIHNCRRFCNANYSSNFIGKNKGQIILPHGKIIVYSNRKGYVPYSKVVHHVTESELRPLENLYLNPTTFVCDTINSSVYLNDSYCPYGINEITVVQKNGNKAIVYDNNGVEIFNGSELIDGVYKFECLLVNIPYESFNRPLEGVYTGTNHEWILTN